MAKLLYESFVGKLDVETRSGYTIELNQQGNLKLTTLSVYSDETDWLYYIKPTDDYNAETDWTAPINDYGTTMAELLLRDCREGGIAYQKVAVK